METYIYLTPQNKKALIHLANVKNLSLSTTAAIIIKQLHPLIETWYPTNKYINKGERRIHIKIRNENKYNITAITATNCIWCYFNRPIVKGVKPNWQNKGIQSQLDKTIDKNKDKNKKIRHLCKDIEKEMDITEDANVNKNMEIRIAWRLKKGLI